MALCYDKSTRRHKRPTDMVQIQNNPPMKGTGSPFSPEARWQDVQVIASTSPALVITCGEFVAAALCAVALTHKLHAKLPLCTWVQCGARAGKSLFVSIARFVFCFFVPTLTVELCKNGFVQCVSFSISKNGFSGCLFLVLDSKIYCEFRDDEFEISREFF